ncbi:MAG: sugar kinase [Candidatus Poribacteria bacterium]|nr:sugar kinase [Candidatus Poribacteria bacterium]
MANVITYKQIKTSECEYDGASLGEVMLRIDPRDVPTARARDNLRIFQGGGETNIACGLAHTFGLRSAVLTALVDDPVGENIRNQLREAGVDVSNILWWNTRGDGSPYSTDAKGSLHNGINFTYVGAGALPSHTTYYRAHSAAAQMKPGDFDFDELFGERGVRVFNTGGILTLIGPRTADLAIEAAQKAAEHGVFVCADLNYRSKVEPNKERARAINQRLAPYLGMLVGNDSDLSDALGYDTEVEKGAPFEEWLPPYQETIKRVAADFPKMSLIGAQWRGAHNADNVSWGATLYDALEDEWHTAALRPRIPIRDRTGGGDSFASGVLAGLLKGKDLQTAVNWGAAHGILVQETPGDITMVNQAAVEAEASRAQTGGGVKASR